MNRSNSDYNRVPRDHSPSPPGSTTFDPYAAYPADSPGHSPSPNPTSRFAQHGNESGYTLPLDLDDAPPRARFMGNSNRGDPSVRASLASSNFLYDGHRGTGSEHGSSVYALNDIHAAGGERLQPSRISRYLDDPSQARDPSHPDHAFADDDSAPSDHAYAPAATPAYMPEKRATYIPRRRRSRAFLIGGIVAAVLVLLAIAIPVAVVESKHKGSSNLSSSDDSKSKGGDSKTATQSGGGSKSKSTLATSGGDGSIVTMEDGTTFTYHNSFGGHWYYDENDPWNNAAQANSWTPPLNQTFTYGVNRIWGVNLGGWLNTEPFIVPALYEPYQNTSTPAVDEWTLSVNLRNDTSTNGGISQLENHYKTFITEEDFAQIAGAGLNFVRIPLPYWAIEVRDNEPFLAKTCWTYFLKAIAWARKYGIRINLDLHAVPGSQNGWNHSGKLGTTGWLNGPMGIANAQRSLDYVRIIAEFISQPQYKDVVTMYGVINEPYGPTIGKTNIAEFYVQAYNIVRAASGPGNPPTISFHEAFEGLSKWQNFLPGADNIALDDHPYLCFQNQPTDQMQDHVNDPCQQWGSMMNTSLDSFGMTAAGEFSLAITDCGLFVNGVNEGTRYEGTYQDPQNPTQTWPAIGSCTPWTDWQNWNATMKTAISEFGLTSMDSLQNWFFWTWKIGNSSVSGRVEAPAWSYQLGLQEGWISQDPRSAVGQCNNIAPRTGGAIPAGTGIAPAALAAYTWPPTAISHVGGSSTGDASTLPTFTPTSALVTLPGAAPMTVSGDVGPTASANVGNGWNNPSDQVQMMVPVATCSYLDPWVNPTMPAPSPLCGGSTSSRKRAPAPPHQPAITPPPRL